MRRRPNTLVLLLLLATGTVQAQEKNTDYWSLQIENDALASSGDRYYTHGIQVSHLKRAENSHWLAKLSQHVPLFRLGEEKNAVSHTIAQKSFTPENTEASELVASERPYAGYLFYEIKLLSLLESNPIIDSGNMLGLTVGVVGPSAKTEQIQRWYHNRIGIDSPNGWANQLNDELTMGISYTRLWSLVTPLTNGLELGISPHIQAELGTVYSYAAGGVTFRLGTHLKYDLTPPNISPGFPGIPFFNNETKFNWYVFAGHESRLVGRNIFLDGNTFSDSHSVEKETLVGDYQFGIAMHIDHVRIALSNMIRTKEYTTQKDQLRYGALNISFFID